MVEGFMLMDQEEANEVMETEKHWEWKHKSKTLEAKWEETYQEGGIIN